MEAKTENPVFNKMFAVRRTDSVSDYDPDGSVINILPNVPVQKHEFMIKRTNAIDEKKLKKKSKVRKVLEKLNLTR
ncbi:hypothetical protein Hokovirus_1_109 [Hokovirus HKV1]|uniref:Uncharacterized protein n=1 Tax=Hokovirus HKV1 TaxID=1977638 RepID=A0A1V0SET1_9VIRU|nr:hypothetical protein Hokovirus_1_109 [Hokovirus HKV1]